MTYTAIIHTAEEGGFWATCAEVPEANGQGETEQEALEDLKSSIQFVLEYQRERGESPEPTRLIQIDVADAA